jgi:hypothetical protein
MQCTKIIAHRGNTDGPSAWENKPEHVLAALSKGFDVEVDVWLIEGKIYLGHDDPDYEIEASFLKDTRFWCHAKNIAALDLMMKMGVHCFFHNVDDVVLTSKGFLWTFPGKILFSNSVCVMPELHAPTDSVFYGICTDHATKYVSTCNGDANGPNY